MEASIRNALQKLDKLPARSTVLIQVGSDLPILRIHASVLSFLIERGFACIYINSMRPAFDLIDRFDFYSFKAREALMNGKLAIVDVISRSVEAPEMPNTVYISSPSDLSELQLGIERALSLISAEPGKTWLVLDGLSTLLVFNSTGGVMQFLIFFIGRLRALEFYGALFLFREGLEKDLESVIKQYVDIVVEI